MSGSALERLVELSVCKKARLDSDSTLVAVITAVSAEWRLAGRDDVTDIVPGQRQGSLGLHSSSTRQYFMPEPRQPSSTTQNSL